MRDPWRGGRFRGKTWEARCRSFALTHDEELRHGHAQIRHRLPDELVWTTTGGWNGCSPGFVTGVCVWRTVQNLRETQTKTTQLFRDGRSFYCGLRPGYGETITTTYESSALDDCTDKKKPTLANHRHRVCLAIEISGICFSILSHSLCIHATPVFKALPKRCHSLRETSGKLLTTWLLTITRLSPAKPTRNDKIHASLRSTRL